VQARQIQLDVLVTDKSGKLVYGLKKNDFSLLDANRPAEIAAFEALGGGDVGARPPAQIVLVIDTINLNFRWATLGRDAVIKFLRENGGRLANPVSVIWMRDTGVETEGAPTTDGNALAAQIEAKGVDLRLLTSNTGTWEAIRRFQVSMQQLGDIVDSLRKKSGRKLVIWAGPGWPLLSPLRVSATQKEEQNLFRTIVDLNTQLREGQIALYGMLMGVTSTFTDTYQDYLKGVRKPSEVVPNDLNFKVLAVQSGGRILEPSNQLETGIERCVQDADGYYRIWFTAPPATAPDEYRDLKLKVNKPGLTVRTNMGYYNQP
jgi:VWFA-related protein